MTEKTQDNDKILTQTCSYKGELKSWSLEALKVYFDEKISLHEEKTKERFLAAKENITIALLASEKAIVKAETANDKRFDSVNEFRSSLADQAKFCVTRNEYAVQHQMLIEKIDNLTMRIATQETKALSYGNAWGFIVAGVGMIVGVIGAVAYIVHMVQGK